VSATIVSTASVNSAALAIVPFPIFNCAAILSLVKITCPLWTGDFYTLYIFYILYDLSLFYIFGYF
jgi:hypothetical protein